MSIDSLARRTVVETPRSPHGSHAITLTLTVEDRETLTELEKIPVGLERDAFALDALRIGVLALRQARGQIDAETVKQEGEKILSALAHQLDGHQQHVHERLTTSLKEYFDPESGRLQERLARLLKKDGELEVMLRQQIGTQDSELARTLASHLGRESPLMKQLDPKQTDGLIATLQSVVDVQLKGQRERILEQFSLDYKDGALSRFVAELEQRQGKLSGELHTKIDLAVKEFSLNDDNSALSCLVRNVREAQQKISSEFSLDQEASALSRLKSMLEETQATIQGQLSLDEDSSALSRLKKELLGLMKTQQEDAQKFHVEVKAVLEAMSARKDEFMRGHEHGVVFEDAVCSFLEKLAIGSGDRAERTGDDSAKSGKKGDMVIELGKASSACGARIVVEAKQRQDFTIGKAQKEIALCKENRDAQVGLFVFSKQKMSKHLDPVCHIDNDVFVVWDAEDAQSDLLLRVGYTVAKALCLKQQSLTDNQLKERLDLEQAIKEVEKTYKLLDDVRKDGDSVIKKGTDIRNNAEKIKAILELQVVLLKERVIEMAQAE